MMCPTGWMNVKKWISGRVSTAILFCSVLQVHDDEGLLARHLIPQTHLQTAGGRLGSHPHPGNQWGAGTPVALIYPTYTQTSITLIYPAYTQTRVTPIAMPSRKPESLPFTLPHSNQSHSHLHCPHSNQSHFHSTCLHSDQNLCLYSNQRAGRESYSENRVTLFWLSLTHRHAHIHTRLHTRTRTHASVLQLTSVTLGLRLHSVHGHYHLVFHCSIHVLYLQQIQWHLQVLYVPETLDTHQPGCFFLPMESLAIFVKAYILIVWVSCLNKAPYYCAQVETCNSTFIVLNVNMNSYKP